MTAVGLSDVIIANQALSRIGAAQFITSFSDNSPQAQQLALWYFADRDAELTDWPWPFAHKYAALNQVSTTGIPANPEWLYSYRYPSDCLAVRRIVQGTVVTNATALPPGTAVTTYPSWSLASYRQDGDPDPYPFEISSDATGRLLLTDCPNAWIRYTYQVQDPTLFSPSFADMLAWRVASDLYTLSKNEERRKYCMQMYEHTKITARAQALNESQNDQPQVDYNSEFVRGRYIG